MSHKLIAVCTLVAAVALPGAVHAAGHNGQGGTGMPSTHHTAATPTPRPTHMPQPTRVPHVASQGSKSHGKALSQFEGVVVSLDNASFVLQPMRPSTPQATILLTATTVITAGKDVTTTMLAAGEQVQVAASRSNNAFTAVRVVIQKVNRPSRDTAAHGPRRQATPEASTTPEPGDDGSVDATPTPESGD